MSDHFVITVARGFGSGGKEIASQLAHDLGIKVLCEGVETEKENINSKNAECDYIQGYYYSRVLPQEETNGFLAKYRKANNLNT